MANKSVPRRHNSNDEIEDECSAKVDWLAYPFLVLPVKKDIPDALDGLPECPWPMIPPANILGFLTGL
jgi:hypothetical protein